MPRLRIALSVLGFVFVSVSLYLRVKSNQPVDRALERFSVPKRYLQLPTPTLSASTSFSPENVISLWMPMLPVEYDFLYDQIIDFELKSGIFVDLKIIPYSEYLQAIRTSLLAEGPPDVIVLNYNLLVIYQEEGGLHPLDLARPIDLSGFLPGSLANTQVGDSLYAVPWLRNGCSTEYLYLGLSAWGDSSRYEAGLALIDFLTEPGTQFFYPSAVYFPARADAFDDRIDCPSEELAPIRLPPPAVQYVVESVAADGDELMLLIEQDLNFLEANAVIVDDLILTRGAPIETRSTPDQLRSIFESRGLIIGAFFVDQLTFEGYPPGHFAVLCTPDDVFSGFCRLMDADGESEILPLESFQELAVPVGHPILVVEPNGFSSFRNCWVVASLKFCISVSG